jgi:hypothetical protein
MLLNVKLQPTRPQAIPELKPRNEDAANLIRLKLQPTYWTNIDSEMRPDGL